MIYFFYAGWPRYFFETNFLKGTKMKRIKLLVAVIALSFAGVAGAQSSGYSWVDGNLSAGGGVAGRYGYFSGGVNPSAYSYSGTSNGSTYSQFGGTGGVSGNTFGRGAEASGAVRIYGNSDASQVSGRRGASSSNSSNSIGMDVNVNTTGNAQASGGGNVNGASGASTSSGRRFGGKG